MRRWAVIAAAGSGSRFGGPKQFERLGERTLLEIAVDLFTGWDGVVCVLPRGMDAPPGAIGVTGGATRRASVAAGLAAVPMEAEVISIHDAARPLATPTLLETLERALDHADCAVPGTPLLDTVKRVRPGGEVESTLVREDLRMVQTPQLFRAEAIRRAHAEVPSGVPAPDDAILLEVLGLRVVVVDWPEDNPKVTFRHDLERLLI